MIEEDDENEGNEEIKLLKVSGETLKKVVELGLRMLDQLKTNQIQATEAEVSWINVEWSEQRAKRTWGRRDGAQYWQTTKK